MNPDTSARVFETIDAYAAGDTETPAMILSLIPLGEINEVAAFALGMLGGFYRMDPKAREVLDIARRNTQ